MPGADQLNTVQNSALVALAALGVLCAAYWLIVLWHVMRTRLKLPTARDGLRLAEAERLREQGPAVCAVIPAHNEREVIGTLARSLRRQDYPRLHVVFALDRCTDDTEEVLREVIDGDPRFTIHRVMECPPDWAGKVHAIHSAVRAATAAQTAGLLLFADADTTFDPACVRACVALLQARRLDLLSLLSTLTTDQWFERIAQPAAAMELVRQYPPLKVGRGAASRPFANGQFMLFRREGYEAVGGHAAAKDELLEDIFLARKIAWSERTVGVLMAEGMLRCRMYPTWEAFRRGWRRIYIEAANCKPSRLRGAAMRLAVTGLMLPAGALIACAAGVALCGMVGGALPWWCGVCGGTGLLSWVIGLGAANRMGGAPLVSTLLGPIGSAQVVSILAEAARDLEAGKAVAWAGREYVRPARP